MPPKVKFTKEQVVDCAFALVRESGIDALSARALAKKMNSSPQPTFSHFDSIEALSDAVREKAGELYSEYLAEGLSSEIPFKGAGLKYIQFAKDEPLLFRMLFMSGYGEISHFFPAYDPNTPKVMSAIEGDYGAENERNMKIYNHMSVYTHGLAVMFAQGQTVFSDEDVSVMLSEVFTALMGDKNE